MPTIGGGVVEAVEAAEAGGRARGRGRLDARAGAAGVAGALAPSQARPGGGGGEEAAVSRKYGLYSRL